jgi:hypothetical protein
MTVEFGGRAIVAKSRIRLEIIFDRLEAKIAILLDLEKPFLLSNTKLHISRRLRRPYKVMFELVIIVVVLLHIVVNNVILLFSRVERTILSGNRLARLLRTIPLPKWTSAAFANNSENFQSSARSLQAAEVFTRQRYACLTVPHWVPTWLRGSNMVAKRGRPFAQTSNDDTKNRRRREARERMARLRLQRKGITPKRQWNSIDYLQHGEFVARLSSAGENNVPHIFCTSHPSLETQNNARDHGDYPDRTETASRAPSSLQDNLGEIVMFGDISQISDISKGHPLGSTVEEHNIAVQSIVSDVGDVAENQGFHGRRTPHQESMPSLDDLTSLPMSDPMTGSSETREYASIQQQYTVHSNLLSPGLDGMNGSDSVLAESFQPSNEDNYQRQQTLGVSDVHVDDASEASAILLVDPKVAHRRRLGAERSRRYYQRKVALLGRPGTRRKDELHHAETVFRIDTAGRSEGCKKKQTLVRDICSPESIHNVDERQNYDNNATFSRDETLPENCRFSEPFEESPRKTLAIRLCDQLIHGFHECSREQHAAGFVDHQNLVGNGHHDLREMFSSEGFTSVIGLPEIAQYHHTIEAEIPQAAQWDETFCGTLPGSAEGRTSVKHVCLHKERTQAIAPNISFDVDSFLGFATSLGVALKGLLYQPSPQARQNLDNDVHFGLEIPESSSNGGQSASPSFNMLRDVPHLFLGRLVGAENVVVHVFFPHLEVNPETSILNASQLSRWNDKILEPAIYDHFPAHFTQHLSAGYQHALANSRARQVEARKIETASYESQQAITYFLPPEHLHGIWMMVQHKIACSPGLWDFRDAQLYISAKGTKLQFKTDLPHPSLNHAISKFQSYLDGILNLEHLSLDRFFVDIGKEICPPTSSVLMSEETVLVEPQVYSWRRCCLQEFIRQLYDGQPPAAGGPGQRYYAQNMLYEACSLTSETPKRSKLREAGLLYSQFYASVKELFDASKCKPFDNDGLEELALDPQIRRGMHAAVRGHLPDYKIIERAYIASKGRVKNALLSSRQKSFGVREEHRISWGLLQEVQSQLSLHLRTEPIHDLPARPTYVWGVKSDVYLNFLQQSADKFAAGFEVMLMKSSEGLVSQEETKMMVMFLKCLRFVFGGQQLQRESALWWGYKAARQGARNLAWYGLGFSHTLPRYGYCWMEQRFDWSQLRFDPQITSQVLFSNDILHGKQIRRRAEVQVFFDSIRRLELALAWLRRYQQDSTATDRLITWVVHICLHQFRVDILHRMKSEMRQGVEQDALHGKQPLCMEYLREILKDRVYVISGNRCDIKNVSDLAHLLFDFDDGPARTHWEDLPFRKLYRRAISGLRSLHSEGIGNKSDTMETLFRKRLWRRLLSYHWILPYPTRDNIMQRTKDGHRMWYS